MTTTGSATDGTTIACEGKQGFDSFPAADFVASRMRSRRGEVTIQVYRCKNCSKYHVGTITVGRAVRPYKRKGRNRR